jgi:hypothetical protein
MTKTWQPCALPTIAQSAIAAFFVFLLGGTVTPVQAGGVTNIKEIVNNTDMPVEVFAYDARAGVATGYDRTQGATRIPARGGTWTGDLWIPWADNADQFRSKHIVLMVRKTPTSHQVVIGAIWQSGEFVRHNRFEEFVANAPRIPGVARSGGDRRMSINKKGGDFVFSLTAL